MNTEINTDFKTSFENVIMTFRNAVTNIRKCNDEEFAVYIKDVHDAAIDRVIEELKKSGIFFRSMIISRLCWKKMRLWLNGGENISEMEIH